MSGPVLRHFANPYSPFFASSIPRQFSANRSSHHRPYSCQLASLNANGRDLSLNAKDRRARGFASPPYIASAGIFRFVECSQSIAMAVSMLQDLVIEDEIYGKVILDARADAVLIQLIAAPAFARLKRVLQQ